MAKEPKRCPLQFEPNPKFQNLCHCLETECAWFIKGDCAIAVIARSLQAQIPRK
jgi:hypothetical protein